MNNNNPYQAYVEGNVLDTEPTRLITALYEAAIESTKQARECLDNGDAFGRSKAISKAVEILTELLLSLNHEKGASLSANLHQLYSYMQCRLLEAHAQKSTKPMLEVEKLLKTLLDAWYHVADQSSKTRRIQQSAVIVARPTEESISAIGYGGYCFELTETSAATAVLC